VNSKSLTVEATVLGTRVIETFHLGPKMFFNEGSTTVVFFYFMNIDNGYIFI